MLTHVITLRFNALLEGFDNTPLREFIKDKEVLSSHDHFFVKDESPYLAVVVNYTLKPIAAEAPAPQLAGKSKRDESWRHVVAEADVPLFNSLRDWRAERAKRQGFPPYIICNNRQLAAIVAARPQSLAQLGEIEGFGQAKLESYGKEILALLAPSQSATTTAAAPPSEPVQSAETTEAALQI